MDVFSNAWRRAEILLAVALISLSLFHAGQMACAMATGSLSTDEFGTIGSFSSKGPWRVITDYRAPKNHVFFNLLNSLLPWRSSFEPARARALSLLAVALTAGCLVVHAARRSRLMEAAVLLALWSLAPQMLSLSMEARGYGFIGLFGVLATLSVLEYLRGENHVWLWILAAATALGTYTLPSFLFFAGPLMAALWLVDRTRWNFIAGVTTLVAILLLYAPIFKQVIAAFGGYNFQGTQEADFRNAHGLIMAMKLYFFPSDDWEAWTLLAVLALSPFAPLPHLTDRREGVALRLVSTACIIFLAVMLVTRTAPIRTAAFVMLPLGIAGLWAIGNWLRNGLSMFVRAAVCGGGGGILLCDLVGAIHGFHFTPTENWTLAGRAIDAAFPASMPVEFNRYAKYLQHTLSDADARAADYDAAAFTEGALVVADASNKWAEGPPVSATTRGAPHFTMDHPGHGSRHRA